jgi:hypothetical protein
MPFKLHPSGVCNYFTDMSANLIAAQKCLFCGRVGRHKVECPSFKLPEFQSSSRSKFFDAAAVLWAKNDYKSFITFTLPSLQNGTYQRDAECPETGDIVIASKFSKVLESYAVRFRRGTGNKLSYVWVSEAQMKRHEKYGGVGDIHFHAVLNVRLKADNNKFVDKETFDWLQNSWCNQVGVYANNSVHVDPIPDSVNSVAAYLSKYLGKGQDRFIHSRRFASTRDLSAFKCLEFKNLPEGIEPIGESITVLPNGYESVTYRYNTRDVLESFGALMLEENKFVGSGVSGKHFTPKAILDRSIEKFLKAHPTLRNYRRRSGKGRGLSIPT